MKLYRFISFSAFMRLLVKKKERFVNPICWEDTREGYLLRIMDLEQGSRKVLELLYDNVFNQEIEMTIIGYLKLWAARWGCYAQCWTECDESDAMWRIYDYEKETVRITTTDDVLKKNLDNINSSLMSYIKSIKYVDGDDIGLLCDATKELSETGMIYSPYIQKGKHLNTKEKCEHLYIARI